MVRMKHVAREHGKQSVVDRELDVASDFVQVRELVAMRCTLGRLLELVGDVRACERATRPHVDLAPAGERLGRRGQCLLVKRLAHGHARTRDGQSILVGQGTNATDERLDGGRQAGLEADRRRLTSPFDAGQYTTEPRGARSPDSVEARGEETVTAVDRKTFLKQGVVSLAALGAAAGPLGGLAARAANGPKVALENGGYGELIGIPEADSGLVLLHLPKGFEYRLLSRAGETMMSDGIVTPGAADGMAAFNWRGNVRVIRNHEIRFDPGQFGPAATAYDTRSGGGTTTLEITRDRRIASSWTSLNGTNFNCAGGATPWETWLTCEETVNGPDANVNFLGQTMTLNEKHGYLFEVPASRGMGELEKGEPIRSAGRFPHEAVAVDPATGIVYQTEDDFAYWSGFFRYIPPNNPHRDKRIEDGGRLQVLGVIPPGANGPQVVNLSNFQEVGVTYRTAWIDIQDPDPVIPQGTANDPASRILYQGQAEPQGAAQFSRLEGIDYFNRRIFLVSTEGGGPFPGGNGSAGFGEGFGQVWVYDIRSETITLLFESPGQNVLDLPDNITISPRRKSVLLCEDSSGANFLRGLTQDGLLFDFALNAFPGRTSDEFAGATFSPDTQTLFVNLQATGATFAIWGPWERGLL